MKRFLQRWSYLVAILIAVLILAFAASNLIPFPAAQAAPTPIPCPAHYRALPNNTCVPAQ